MSFSFSASGNADEVTAALKAIELPGDVAGRQLRDFIILNIGDNSAELEEHQVYVVRAHGHASPAGFTLGVTVELGDRKTDGAELADVAAP